jgi:hypothetical protein
MRRVVRITKSRLIALYLVICSFCVSALVPAASAQQKYPTYTLDSSVPFLNSGFLSDIAGSAFVDTSGTFHWSNGYNSYDTSDDGTAWAHTFTNTDMGALNADYSTTTLLASADTYYGTAGTLCYQIDKQAAAVPSPYEDDHCDIVGTWTDPSTGTWYVVINDEYDFNPLGTGTYTVAQRVSTGVHSNRIMYATSTNYGASWTLGGEIITSPYNVNDAANTTVFPGATWSYGVAGCRLFIDNSTGYFYVIYNNSIKWTPDYGLVFTWFNIARAPISSKMASGSWNKWYNGTWTQPGLGGLDGWAGNPHNLNVAYTPSSDALAFSGTGVDGSTLSISYTKIPSSGAFTFNDASGNTYTANVSSGTITNASGTSVSSVSYSDPALNDTIAVAVVNGAVEITSTSNATGAAVSSTPAVGNPIFENTATNRLYVPENPLTEEAFSYNVYMNRYLGVGYDNNAYQLADLGSPNGLSIIGAEPSSATGSYLTNLDYGSLTNQGVSSRSYRIISDLSGGQWDVTMYPHSSEQTYYATGVVPSDSNGNAISTTAVYTISIGGTALREDTVNQTAEQWIFVPIADPFETSYNSGFYKLQNVYYGNYLQVSGSSAAAQRAIGATVTEGSALTNFAATGNSSNGTPGGSDQWYLLPIGNDTPATLSNSSSSAMITAATNTSLAGVTTYKLVNRNSGFPVQIMSGTPELQGHQFSTNSSQALTITPVN